MEALMEEDGHENHNYNINVTTAQPQAPEVGVLTRAAAKRKLLLNNVGACPSAAPAPAPAPEATKRKNPPRKARKVLAARSELEEKEEEEGTAAGSVSPVRGSPPLLQTLLEAGQFVAVAAGEENDPFWLARLKEAVNEERQQDDEDDFGGTTTATTTTKREEGRRAGSDGRKGGRNQKSQKTGRQQQMVRVHWLEPRPPRKDSRRNGRQGGSATTALFEEFVEGQDGAIPVDSIMCRVNPEPQKGGCWRLGRRDKLRIFRVRVEDRPPAVEWLTSHLLPDRIIWSSHPALLEPDISFDFSAEEHLLQQEEEEKEEEQTPSPAAERMLEAMALGVGVPMPGVAAASATGAGKPSCSAAAENQKLFKRAARLLNEAPAVLVMAGAGMGKDSGLPDYRGAQGFWRSYPPLAKLGITFSESMDPTWFKKDPQQAWGFYGHRAELYSNTTPHGGFDILRRLGETKGDNFFIATSNIDEQFQKAGFAERRIYECHGSLGYVQCATPCSKHIWRLDADKVPRVDTETLRVPCSDTDAFPRCPVCGEIARPNVSLASDTQDTWVEDRSMQQKERLLKWLRRVMRGLDHNDDDDDNGGATTIPSDTPGGPTFLKKEEESSDSDAGRWSLVGGKQQEQQGGTGQHHRQGGRQANHRFVEHEEEFERIDDWREIRAKRKRASVGEHQRCLETGSGDSPVLQLGKRWSNMKLVVVELGCGDSLHSLRIEAELMSRENPSVKLIRINPNFQGKMKRGHIAIKMGALEALAGISKHLLSTQAAAAIASEKSK